MAKTPRVVLWDLETSPMVVATYSLYPDSIPHENIIDDWYIICAAWKEVGKDKTYAVSVLDDPKRFKKNVKDDYYVVKTLRDMLEDVDILVAHNNKAFDWRKYQARLIYHKLPPLPKILLVDTLKEVKSVSAFSSNRLDYLCKRLNGEGKIETSKGLWMRVMEGNVKAIKEMVKYNKGDITCLEELYMILRPYMKSHPNMATPDTCNCPKCNSNKVVKDGIRMRSTGARYQVYKCNGCGGNFTDTKNLVKPLSKV
jgi:DNA-directed RNA polymerase subunit M/transcription elongation factor TFIIS